MKPPLHLAAVFLSCNNKCNSAKLPGHVCRISDKKTWTSIYVVVFLFSMCTQCSSIYTRSSFLHVDRATPFKQYFPCGYCADCIRKKRSEWSLRAFYEMKNTIRNGGFVLFDTLTYCDEKLVYFHDIYPPALHNAWDFMSFSRKDVQDFFDKLRKFLKRGVTISDDDYRHFGYYGRKFVKHLPSFSDSVGKVRYLLTSEYGTSEEYNGRRCTHRPHYHVLFFVNFDIDPLLFSQYVSAAWYHGRTDGFPFKSLQYVNNERVIRSTQANALKLIRYVSKYISKDMYLYRKLYNRCYKSFSIANPNWQRTYNGRLAFRRFKNQVLPFHLQSQGFGAQALEFEDTNYIDDHQAIRMPISSNGVIASIPLSTYFKRKLYFNFEKFNGKVRWYANDKYFDVQKKRLDKSVVMLRNRLFSWDNFLTIGKATEIAKYHLLWRGLLIPKRCLSMSDTQFLRWRYRNRPFPCHMHGDDVVSDVKTFYNFSCGPHSFRYDSADKVLTLADQQGAYIADTYSPPLSGDVVRCWSPHEFATHTPDNMVVVDSRISRFVGYDAILDDYQVWLKECGDNLNYQMFQSDLQNDRYKVLGFLN